LNGFCFAGNQTQDSTTIKSETNGPGDAQDSFGSKESRKINYELSGRIHRTNVLVDDGISQNIFFMDSDQAPSRIKLQANTRVKGNFTVGGNIEIGVQSNRPSMVNQENPNPGAIVRILSSEINFSHNSIGYLDLGTGFSSSAVVIEYDLSGTSTSALVLNGLLLRGMSFGDEETDSLSNKKVSDYFYSPERLLITDRIRYRSPVLLNGLQLSGSVASDRRCDASLRYFRLFKYWNLKAFVSYEQKPTKDLISRSVLGASIKHRHSGISLTSLYAIGTTEIEDWKPGGYLIKFGIERELSSIGSTSFSVDLGEGVAISTLNESTTSTGAFVQQNIESLNLDVYLGYRKYEIHSNDNKFHPLQSYTLGVLFTF